MLKTLCNIVQVLVVSACLSAGIFTGDALAQCYPGLACPSISDPGPAPQPIKPQDAIPPPQEINPAPSGQRSFWTHNGSLVYLTADGANRSFFYEAPREAIRAAGARPGTLLFRGRRQGSSYRGTAFVFAGRCGAIPYNVEGSVSDEEKRLTLLGEAPSGISQDCRVTGHRKDVLIFEFSHRQ